MLLLVTDDLLELLKVETVGAGVVGVGAGVTIDGVAGMKQTKDCVLLSKSNEDSAAMDSRVMRASEVQSGALFRLEES